MVKRYIEKCYENFSSKLKVLPKLNDTSISFISNNKRLADKFFIKDDGSQINLIPNYRWSVKQGWRDFKGLFALSFLNTKGLLNAHQRSFFVESVNEFTITKSEAEIDSFLLSVLDGLDKNPFYKDDNGDLFIQPSHDFLDPKIHHYVNLYKRFANKNSELQIAFKNGNKVLEIGFESGGYSIFALEKLGLKVFGIDNGYSGIKDVSSLPLKNAKILESNAKFINGDITKKTEFDNNFFDLISSEAVLEHILDLPNAFLEMHRILKPGGLLFHSYDPYFHPGGGHALGILDRPWMHLELNESEYERFLIEKRPFEAKRAFHWYKHGLNKSYTQGEMINCLLNAGFKIIFWESNRINFPAFETIDRDTLRNSYKNYPNISIDDLITSKHSFIAIKSE